MDILLAASPGRYLMDSGFDVSKTSVETRGILDSRYQQFKKRGHGLG
ncbi:MAG: hypothetical protein QOJ04_5136 [Caballeronia sp.]|jgi:hypothetical protein|nr:hypothetical protein [Caballeronia sp.]